MDYDVFISCKSEDYKYAESIYNFLKDNGINAFLASTELRRLGISEYRRAVVQAMKTAYHLIVFASKPEYVDSRWVYYEWDMFINAKLKGRKQGQILTILKDIDVDDINMDLWKYESFAFSNYRDTLLNYVETPNSMRRKELAKRREEEAAEQIRIQVEQKRNQLKKDIQNKESEYFHLCQNLNLLSREIVDLWKEIGVTKKSCPICGEETFIDSNYCRNCGWTFIPMFPTKNISSEEHLQISRRNWKLISQLSYISNLEDMDDIYERFQKAISESSLLKQENERLLQENRYIEYRLKEIVRLNDNHKSSVEEANRLKYESNKYSQVKDVQCSCFGAEILEFEVGACRFKMIPVEAGTFTMGATPEQKSPDNDEIPAHKVTLTDNYYIGQTEVTQALWKAVMGVNPSYFKGDNRPVEQVSWNDCQKFISKLNTLTGRKFRLPTEAEWEYAARGGKKSREYQYSGSNILDEVAWYDDNSQNQTHEVATKLPNELGVYDMSGNVWEWCQDQYGSYGRVSQTNPTGVKSGSERVHRGGGWYNVARGCRSSSRNYDSPDKARSYLGLRLVLSE